MNKGYRDNMRFISPANKELISRIINAVCKYYSIKEHLIIKSKDRTICEIRFLCYWIVFNNTNMSAPAIGLFFNKKRNTVEYGIGKVAARMSRNPYLVKDIKKIIMLINKGRRDKLTY